MKTGFRVRFTAVLLVAALLFTSNYMILHIFADTPTLGIGINNHVMTQDDESETKYILKFYRTVKDDHGNVTKTLVSFPNEMEVDAGRHLYLEPEGANAASIILGKNDELVLSDSERFKNYLKQFEIDTIEISYQTGKLNQKETSLLYSEPLQTYSFVDENGDPIQIDKDDEGNPIYLVDYHSADPFEHINQFTVKQFDSTKMTTIDVEQDWRDRGTGRPELQDVSFDLKKGDVVYLAHDGGTYVENTGYYQFTVDNDPQHTEPYSAYLELEQATSNTYLYHYTVPECDREGNTIVYTSEQHFPEPKPGDTAYKNVDTPEDNNYLAVGLTSFSFKMNFADKYDPSARPEITAAYIENHFNFKCQGKEGAADTTIPLTDDDLEVKLNADGSYTVTIKNLEDIAENGTANEYFLELKNPSQPRVTINENAKKADKDHDYYVVRSENSGIHASVTNRTYHGGDLNLLLSGTTEFSGHVQWDDHEVQAARKADENAANFSLWRFTGDNDDESAIVYNNIVLSGTDTEVARQNLPKYDITGEIYTYYAREEVTVEKDGVAQPYQITYKDSDNNPKNRLENGGAVINKLSDTVVYSVSAEWIAAARQGGTASATYQLQRRLKTPDGAEPEAWEKVGEDKTLTFDELHMSRGGSEDCKFPEVDMYNEKGKLYEYRVIQTSVTRTDVMVEGESPVSKTNDTEITETGEHSIEVNDSYFVVLTNPEGSTDFHFLYQIQGNTKVNIEKQWVDENRQPISIPAGSTEYGAQFDVQNFNQKNLEYRDYFVKEDYPNGYFDDYLGEDGYFTDKDEHGNPLKDSNNREIVKFKQTAFQGATWSVSGIPVPRFDSEGREIVYRAVEINKKFPTEATIDDTLREVSFYSVYQWNVTYDTNETHTTNYNYVATNIRTIEGEDSAEIAVNKEWVDDGELEFRRPVQINASGSTYKKLDENGEWQEVHPAGASRVLKNENVWESRFPITIRYKRDDDGKRIKDENGKYVIDTVYQYNPADFTETPVGAATADGHYWSIAEIEQARQTADGTLTDQDLEWIYQLLTSKTWNSNDMSDKLDETNSKNLMNENGIGFNNIVGIYKSDPIDSDPRHCHYYAVQQFWNEGGVNGAYATLRFVNTRIGVVNYEIKFDWKVGDALTRQDDMITNVKVKIEGEGLPGGSVELEIDPSKLVRLENGDYAYYVLNLPKYDEQGKLIDYKITEISVNNRNVNEDNVVMVGNDRCTVSVSDEGVSEGNAARSDDLHTIRITNTFSDDIDIQVHKRWVDDGNAENTRSDLYIKLFRISNNPDATATHGGTVENPEKIGTDYKWEQKAQDELNYWTYRFEELPKYDSEGYPYTYYVKEQDYLPFYKQEYERHDSYQESGATVKNPLVFLNDEQLKENNLKNIVFNEGTITNRLYDELVINGEKLWKNISGLLEKGDYPIAYVTLYRDLSSLTESEKNALNLNEEEAANNEIQISKEAEVKNGAVAFQFTEAVERAKKYGVALDESGGVRTDANGNIILLKYNEFGKRIRYKIKEKSLNGYVSKIEDSKLINEYNGGRKLKFDVTKHWEGMDKQNNFPTIKFVLHQVFAVPDDEGGTKYYEMNHFEREYKASDKADYQVTFGDKPMEADALRYYSPIGEPYTYFITETISNYDGDQALFILEEHEKLIPKYMQQFRSNDKAQVVYINSDSDAKGLALGFSAQRTEYLGDARDNVRRALYPQDGDELPVPTDIVSSVPTVNTPTEAQMQAAFNMLTAKQKLKLLSFQTLTPEQQQAAFDLLTTTQKYRLYGNSAVEFDTLTDEQRQSALEVLTDEQLRSLFGDNEVTFDSLDDNQKKAAFDSLTPPQQRELYDQQNENAFNNLTDEQKQAVYDELNARDEPAITLDETVQNTYQPDENNFQGKIDVSKKWDCPVDVNEKNQEYDTVRSYSFTVTRRTKLSAEERLFKIVTSDIHTNNGVPKFDTSSFADGIIMDGVVHGTIRPHDFEPSMVASREIVVPQEGETPKYYVGVLLKDNKAVTVIIDVADENGTPDYHNDVHIEGLAIYGHDALLYDYTITEDTKPGYTPVVKSGTKKLGQEDAAQQNVIPKVNLENRLEVFDLTINKSFGREYTDVNGNTVIDPIPKADFPQFFNDEYFSQLTFLLCRKTDSMTESVPSSYASPSEATIDEPVATPDEIYTVEGGEVYKVITGKEILELAGLTSDTSKSTEETRKYNGLKETEGKDNAYYYHVFRDLPLTDTNGNYYTYWLQEIDGAQAQNNDKVFTLYSPELRAKDTSDRIEKASDVNIPLAKEDNGTDKELYAQNIFKAKRITINKFWLDNNNEDGKRPDELTVTVSEKVPNGDGSQDRIHTFDRVLKKENSTSEIGWTLEAALARYYFNGVAALDNLEYKIGETASQVPDYTLITEAGTYGGATATDPNIYFIPGRVNNTDVPLSDVDYQSIGNLNQDDGKMTSLNLTNYKKPQKGTLTLEKAFNGDSKFKSDTRPESLYFKLTDQNGVTFTDYAAQLVTVKVGENDYIPDANGIITLTRDPNTLEYPKVTVENLPIGSSAGGDVQKNGTYTARQYKFIECNAYGNDLDATFPYTWDGGQKSSASNGSYSVKTVKLDNNTLSNEFGITNTLKREDHKVYKQWVDGVGDVGNYYNTRKNEIHVQLQRQTVGQDTWDIIENDIKLDTSNNKVSLAEFDYSSLPEFRELPQYDKDGNKYYYRVVETYIGLNQGENASYYKVDKTYHDIFGDGLEYPASTEYFVKYDSSETDKETHIGNYIRQKTDYVNLYVQKFWNDNSNQDGNRTPVVAVLKQFQLDNNQQEIGTPALMKETLNESNNWFFQWTNYPEQDEKGVAYHYEIYEETVDGYSTAYNGRIMPIGNVNYREQQITNSRAQEFKDLTVKKKWEGENEADKQLRPDSITYELCCQYTAYKYNDDHTGFLPDEEKSHDGPIEGATELLNKLYDNYWYTTSDDPKQTQEAYISSLPETFFRQTVTPTDRTVDNDWTDVTFTGLPVNINTCAEPRWFGKSTPITYYVKEIAPTFESGKTNPYTYGVNGFKADGEGTSNAVTLTDGTEQNPSTVTEKNVLKRRAIEVRKVWDDNGYQEQNLHYDIDFTLTCAETSSGYSYQQTQKLTKDSTPNSVTFVELPVYDKDGSLLTYEVTEKVNGSDALVKYGYVQGTPVPKDENGVRVGYTITNTLPVVRFKADKVWADNQNQDGKRPEQLNLTLSRTAESVTDTVKVLSDTSAAHQNTNTLWNADFNVQPRYNANNAEYSYSITEEADGAETLASRGYTRYVSTVGGTEAKADYIINESDNDLNVVTVADGTIPVKTFHFMNRYTPQDDSLKIVKQWEGDTDYYTWTRPQNVTVTLYAQYNGGNAYSLESVAADDPVRKLFPSGYQFTRQVTAGNSWQETFGNLPLNVNPTGTAVYNGQKYAITYSVAETPLNGYTKNDHASTTLNGANDVDELTVTNTLKTKTVRVQKHWQDQSYSGDQSEHYAVNLTLANTNDGVSYTDHNTIPKTDAADTEIVTFLVPQYIANGDAATYTVTEDDTDTKYGYVKTYSDNHNFNAVEIADNALIEVSNRLPLTEVRFQKTWNDENDTYQIRPSSIQVQLFRRTADSSEEWQPCGDKVTVTGNDWAAIFSKLPKFNENNLPYEYKVVEDKVNAYDTAYETESGYQDDPVVKQDNTTRDTDSTISFGVKNTLIQKTVTVTKVWDDHEYPNADSLHYPVTFTIAKPNGAAITFSDVDVSLGTSTWTDTRTVPVYDRNGDPIQYSVTETKTQHHYGYTQEGDTVVTQNGTHSGNGQFRGNYYDTYTITNELPLTDITAKKQWNGDLELYPNSSATVRVNLTRQSDNRADNSFNAEQQIAYDTGTTDSVTFSKLLAKDYDNNVYTYTVTEQTVKGYNTTYDNQNVVSTAADRIVTVINTPLKGAADFVKYDLTDWRKHGSDSRFELQTLPGAQFELHRVLNEDDKTIIVAQTNAGTDGDYTVMNSGTTVPIVSDSNGKIVLRNLEPNQYYLKETQAPTGYQLNDTRFVFDVSVNDNNEIVVTYTQSAAPAQNKLTDLTRVASQKTPASTHGIPNEENLSKLTLTKLDKNNTELKLPYATYYLLRLYNYEYRKDGAQGSNEQEYLTNALRALTADYSASSALWTYWERVGEPAYTTDSNGNITVEGHMFGTYVFYEVKNPVGFDRDFTYGTTYVSDNAEVLGPVHFNSGTAQHDTEVYRLTHEDPRKKAEIKILKTDENGNPLKDAVFKLYKDGDPDTVLATVTTGYDGMNAAAIELDTTLYDWGQKFYFIEETAPTGYAPHNSGDKKNKIEFSLTREVADETLHVVRANDVRLKGSVTLTKTSSAATAAVKAGSPLAGARFELYTKDGTKLSVYQHSADPSKYRVRYDTDQEDDIIGADYSYSSVVTAMTTGSDGKLTVEGIDWGDFYLNEIAAPAGYRLPAGEAAKVSFSVGRNTCGPVPQELMMKNDPQTAQLNIIKHIDQKNAAAWGEPVFIFKVRQTAYYDYTDGSYRAIDEANQPVLTKTISPQTAAEPGYEDATGWFDLEPGTYTVTEVRVARYRAAAVSVTTDQSRETGKVTDMTNTEYTAAFQLAPDGKAEVRYDNRLANYEKLNHADEKHNRFNGFKALKVSDKDGLTLDAQNRVTIPKSDLIPKLIRSDGSTVDITDYAKLHVSATESEITVTDNGDSITVSGRIEDVASSVYRLKAEYGGLTTDFELRFAANSLFKKTEKTVIFRNDEQNRSYYIDGSEHNAVYSLIFIIDATTGTPEVRKILHNGVSTGNTTTASFLALQIESMFTDVIFDKWHYAYTSGGSNVSADADSAGLLEAIKTAPNDAVITVTAVLKSKS